MVDAGEGCIGWGARDRDLMRGTVLPRCVPGLDTCTSLCTLAVAVQAVVEFRQPCGNRGSLNAASSPK